MVLSIIDHCLHFSIQSSKNMKILTACLLPIHWPLQLSNLPPVVGIFHLFPHRCFLLCHISTQGSHVMLVLLQWVRFRILVSSRQLWVLLNNATSCHSSLSTPPTLGATLYHLKSCVFLLFLLHSLPSSYPPISLGSEILHHPNLFNSSSCSNISSTSSLSLITTPRF